MPDDQNVTVGGAEQTHSARVKFASDAVREKVGDLLAEAAAPLNLLPLLKLLLAACGKAAPDIAGRPYAEDGERAGPPGEVLSAETSSGEGSAGDDVSGGWRFVKASTRAGKPPPPPREEASPEPLVPPEQPAPVAPPPDPFAPGSTPAGGQPISFFVTDDPVENARINYSQLASIIILTAVMGAFNIWG